MIDSNDGQAMMITTKGRVALEPFPDMSVKTQTVGAGAVKVTRIENQGGLTKLRVVFPSEDLRFRAGYFAWVRGSQYTAPWAKEIHDQLGKKFILAPDTVVEAVSSV